LEGMGHKVVESVSKTTTAVVVQDVDSTSSKVEKARELGVKVITEKDIHKFI
jgi:DNA ligase (NAD+)